MINTQDKIIKATKLIEQIHTNKVLPTHIMEIGLELMIELIEQVVYLNNNIIDVESGIKDLHAKIS